MHVSGTANTAVSLSGENLNNNESNITYLSESVSIFQIGGLEDGSSLCGKYK